MSSQTQHLSRDDFDARARGAGTVSVVDFWAPWCGPCQALGPAIDDVAERVDGEATVAKVNVDKNPDLATTYGVASIPTLIFFRDGEVVDRWVGGTTADAIESRLRELRSEAA